MGEFSITHLLLIAAIFLLFFGPSRLPQLGQSLGKAIRGFKQGLNEIDVEAKDVPKDPTATQTTTHTTVQTQVHTHPHTPLQTPMNTTPSVDLEKEKSDYTKKS